MFGGEIQIFLTGETPEYARLSQGVGGGTEVINDIFIQERTQASNFNTTPYMNNTSGGILNLNTPDQYEVVSSLKRLYQLQRNIFDMTSFFSRKI